MTEGIKKGIHPLVQLIIVVAYFILLFLMSALTGEDPKAMEQLSNQEINLLKMFQVIGVTLIFILPVFLFSRFVRQERLSFLNMNKRFNGLFFMTAITSCLIAMPLVAYLAVINSKIHLPESFASFEAWMMQKEKAAETVTEGFFLDRSTTGLIVNLFVVAFMAGLSEELFFRGTMQQLFIKNKMNLHLAIWLTAALFSAFHFQFYGFFPRLLLGALLGYLYAYTGNLWVSILAHSVNNGFQVLLIYSAYQQVEELSPEGQTEVPLVYALLSAAMVIGQLWFVRRYSVRNGLI